MIMLGGINIYRFIFLISAFIRQFLLPNPYKNIMLGYFNADLFNILIGSYILHKLSFWLAGCGYYKGIDEPATGSILYLICYCILTAIITLLGKFLNNIKIFLVLFVVIYIALIIVVTNISNRIRNF